ncbi:MAG: TonB-dependent receptor [Acidobacteria bacterium]|nr:MAG: TonB-dependent receptor [Acidobacteriota bacterium]
MKSILAAILLLASIPLLQSQAGEGTIAGEVVLTGQPPPPAPPTPVKPADARVCGAQASDESVVVSGSGDLKNVIVYVENPPAGAAAAPARVKLTNRNCRFQPRVQTASVGSTLVVGNDDNILHNTHGYLEGGATFFNLGLPFQGVEVSRPLARPGMVTFKCDAGHTWMRGFLLVLDHRFHAVSDAAGLFRIPAVPPGGYRLKAWHEKLGTRDAPVTVKAGEDAKVRIDFKVR